ncbi:MAG: M20/M25/M40 family metallo-hydrolase [Pirellulaceae bacterium]|nr:M20/M25/M40 family metallo-hydrolase [Pirellulaceae bacterium]
MMQSAANRDLFCQPDVRRALELALQLMPIAGRSGQEREVAEFVRRELRQAGCAASALQTDSAHRRTPGGGQTGNLLLSLPGTVRAPRRMLSAHLDTVPICVGCQPQRQGDLIRSADPNTGLGADDRAGVAVILNTAIEILRRGLPHPPLTFCWFVQEETGLHGSRCLTKSRLGKPAMAFNWDGGSPAKLTVGATGGYRLEIQIRGLASHAGNAPEWGVSAIAIASLAIADLHRSGWHGDVRKGRQRGTSNVGVIQGGDATNVVTDRVLVRAEARSHQPQFRKRIVAQIEKAFRSAAAEVKNAAGAKGSVEIEGRLDYESYRLSPHEPCVAAAAEAVRAVGREPELAVTNGGLDANWLVKHGIPTVSLGCGQLHPHMTSEALLVPDFEDACRIALRLATV